MPIPNTITRTLDLAHPQEKVWAALTTLDGITGWFGSHADGEMTPGHNVRMRWEQYDDGMKTLAIKVVDPMSVFAFCWGISGAPEGDPRQTYVEFALEPTASGTRLTVTERLRPAPGGVVGAELPGQLPDRLRLVRAVPARSRQLHRRHWPVSSRCSSCR